MHAPALDDTTIVAIFDAANTSDIETGELGAKKGSTKEIRDFGAMLARDHKDVRQQGRPGEEAGRDPNVAEGRRQHEEPGRHYEAPQQALGRGIRQGVSAERGRLPRRGDEDAAPGDSERRVEGPRDEDRTRIRRAPGCGEAPARQQAM
jgi:uncharacterized protein DUF4142